jgi:hypothetical protein
MNDPVNHPNHYTYGGIECLDFIDQYNLNFELGNAVKYISRAGKKEATKTIEDLEKARFYVEREITQRSIVYEKIPFGEYVNAKKLSPNLGTALFHILYPNLDDTDADLDKAVELLTAEIEREKKFEKTRRMSEPI